MLFSQTQKPVSYFYQLSFDYIRESIFGGCGGVPVGAGCTARKIVDIIMPKAVINAPIVSPSRLNSSLNLSKRGLVSSFIISFIRHIFVTPSSLNFKLIVYLYFFLQFLFFGVVYGILQFSNSLFLS